MTADRCLCGRPLDDDLCTTCRVRWAPPRITDQAIAAVGAALVLLAIIATAPPPKPRPWWRRIGW